MKEIVRFHEENRCNLRHRNTFRGPIVNSVYSDTETILFLGPKIWELIPTQITELVF